MAEIKQPLVSVVVVSYNSADTIAQTLDSIFAQSYPQIELIVSDDCSADNTVAVAQEWAATHADRFVNCVIHANPENLGVPGNLNAGIRLSHGVYIKDLAADDLLLPDCIAQSVAFCEENGCNNLCARVRPFYMDNGKKVYCDAFLLDEAFFQKDPAAQYPDMLVENRILSPTFFSTRTLLEEMGMYDPRYRFAEDYPMYLKISKSGNKLYFLDAYTVEYRISENSLSNVTTGRAVHPGYHRTTKSIFYRARFFELLKYGKFKRVLSEMRKFLCNDLIILFGNDLSHGIVRFLTKLRDSHLTTQ